jgi:uncharacterized membrane protein
MTRTSFDDGWIADHYQAFTQQNVMWHRRMDVTADWTAPLLIAIATFTLGDRGAPHLVLLLLGIAVIGIAVLIEARRYGFLHHSTWRVHLVEVGYFASQLSGIADETDWKSRLASDLRDPHPLLSAWTSVRMRLRAMYLLFLYLVVVAWVAKLVIHPRVADSAWTVLERMEVGPAPGWSIGIVVTLFLAVASAVTMTAPRSVDLDDESGCLAGARHTIAPPP